MCTNIFIRKDGKWLLMKRSPQKKFAPDVVHPFGGKIDLNENPFLGAKREILEETGLQVKNIKLEAVILEITPVKDRDENWLIFHFSADYDSGELIESEEGLPVFLTDEEVKKEKLFPSVRVMIDNIINPSDGTAFATVSYNEDGSVNTSTLKLDICSL